jgi:hypothetical protein
VATVFRLPHYTYLLSPPLASGGTVFVYFIITIIILIFLKQKGEGRGGWR